MPPVRSWRDLGDAAREREYSPSSVVGEIGPLLAEYRTRSDAISASREEVRYGPGAEQLCVLFRAPAASAPLHLFVHGGYWQELSVADSLFPAAGFAFLRIPMRPSWDPRLRSQISRNGSPYWEAFRKAVSKLPGFSSTI